jgi:hypothetical protein
MEELLEQRWYNITEELEAYSTIANCSHNIYNISFCDFYTDGKLDWMGSETLAIGNLYITATYRTQRYGSFRVGTSGDCRAEGSPSAPRVDEENNIEHFISLKLVAD